MKKSIRFISSVVGLILILLFFVYLSKPPFTAEVMALKYIGQIELSEKDGQILEKALRRSKDIWQRGEMPTDPWYLLKITGGKEVRNYCFTETPILYDMQKNFYIKISAELAGILANYLKPIEEISPFGSLMPWDEVDKVFPRMSKGRIRDLETGLNFDVQRRGGSLHADVQPLTSKDTEIFKKIYHDKWSWKRRAVVLEIGGKKIAASINGMPHGQGAIFGNNFPGHFCIHFYKSHTHSRNLDTAHQLMVLKAAGKIESYLNNKTAPEIVEIALTALRENDHQLIVLTYVIDQELSSVLDYMKKISGLKIHSIKELEENRKYLVDLEWFETESGSNYHKEIELILEKSQDGYLVRANELMKAFNNC